MNKRKPGIDKAVAFLNDAIRLKKISDRLPPIRILADKAEVSFVTMWKAIRELKLRGIISDNQEIIFSDKMGVQNKHYHRNGMFLRV